MMRATYLVIIYLIVTACEPKEYTFQMDMDLDSVQFDLYHYASGKIVYTARFDRLADQKIKIPLFNEDMYTISIHWDRTYVPHQFFKRKNGKITFDYDNKYYLIKNVYINPTQSRTMLVSVDHRYTKEKLETAAYYEDWLRVDQDSKDFQLSEKYDQIYIHADSLQAQNTAALKKQLIESVEMNDFEAANRINMVLKSDTLDKLSDRYIKEHLQAMIMQNNESAVSTFYLFKELLENRNFSEYHKVFTSLRSGATLSPYYKMLKKQYHSR